MNIIIAISFLITTLILIALTIKLYDARRKLANTCAIVCAVSFLCLGLSIWNIIINI